MTHLEADTIFEANLAASKQRWAAYNGETRRLLAAALAAGKQVVEVNGWRTVWPSPNYHASDDGLVAHLMNRHLGFGWCLEIDGEVRKPYGRDE